MNLHLIIVRARSHPSPDQIDLCLRQLAAQRHARIADAEVGKISPCGRNDRLCWMLNLY